MRRSCARARAQKGEKGQREVNFYEQAERLCPQLGPFLPAFHGTHIFHAMRYLAMEDIAIRFNEPCVLDIKIGVRTYEPTASREKVESELSKCPAQAAVGFRPCGMRVYGTHSRQYRCRNKDWGRAITTQTAPSLLAEFVCDDDESSTVRRIRRVVPPLVKRLRELEAVMCAIEGLRFFASSVVIVYEGREGDARRGEAEEAHAHARIDLRMVDFAHWVRRAGRARAPRAARAASGSRANVARHFPPGRARARAHPRMATSRRCALRAASTTII